MKSFIAIVALGAFSAATDLNASNHHSAELVLAETSTELEIAVEADCPHSSSCGGCHNNCGGCHNNCGGCYNNCGGCHNHCDCHDHCDSESSESEPEPICPTYEESNCNIGSWCICLEFTTPANALG